VKILEAIKNKIKNFLEERFEIEFDGEELTDDSDLFEEAYIDSLESLVIISFLEKTFNIDITPENIIESDFRSLNDIAALVVELTG
jgi:acyl carrier protein